MAARKIARGALRQDPKYTTQPVKDGGEKTAGGTDDVRGDTKGARRAAERLARRTPTERLSPGVYRSASGDLVTQAGRPIQRRPQAPMAQQIAGGMQGGMAGQVAGGMQGGMAGQIAGQQMGQGQDPMQAAYEAAGMGGGVQNQYLQMTPEQSQAAIGAISGMGKTPPGWSGGPVTDMMYRNPQMPQMPQASANMGGRYRLSPGVYGSREQAMQQYNQQLAQMQMQPAMQAANEVAGQGSPNSGPGSFPMQQRERELGYAENRFDAARNNNLFRGNPVRRFKF